MEKVQVERVMFDMRIPFWNTKILDGSWPLDGGNMLDAVRVPLERNSRIAFALRMEKISEKAEGDITVRKDLWCLNGECLLDGTRKMDAEMTKEVL